MIHRHVPERIMQIDLRRPGLGEQSEQRCAISKTLKFALIVSFAAIAPIARLYLWASNTRLQRVGGQNQVEISL